MHTKAVYRASRALNQVGLRTLRFNFRGVGLSTGTFDEGIGEEEDVRAALDWLELGLREEPLIVGGMSFGSMVGLKVGAGDPRVVGLVAIGVPIEVYDYGYLFDAEKPILVVQGEEDEFGSGSEVRRLLGGLGSHVTVKTVPGSGHLFEGYLEELQAHVRDFFTSGPGHEALKSKEDQSESGEG
jgi:alpha/beta superfamily hydrolase